LEAENRELKDKLADQGREGGGKAANEGWSAPALTS
jgi:hypothetical protein